MNHYSPKPGKPRPRRESNAARLQRSANSRYSSRYRKRGRMDYRHLALMLVLIAAFLYGAINLISYGIRSAKTRATNAQLEEMYLSAGEEAATPDEAEPDTATPGEAEPIAPVYALLDEYQYFGNRMQPDIKKLYDENGDTIAWLRIPGVVSLPVVYRDNTYYLDHDFYGKKNKGGTLFLDEAHMFASDTQYLVVHGHNMTDGTMFGLLSHYRRKDYMQEHPTVYFNTLFRNEEYRVVGVFLTPDSPENKEYVAFTGNRKFRSLEQFESFAETIYSNSLTWAEGEQLLPTDSILALSTCYGEDDRIVVVCKRVKPV